MTILRVGQRVRYVGEIESKGRVVVDARDFIGQCGVIRCAGIDGWDWVVTLDVVRGKPRQEPALGPRDVFADSCMLRPLTDPKADAFIESIKKIAREPNNVVTKEVA